MPNSKSAYAIGARERTPSKYSKPFRPIQPALSALELEVKELLWAARPGPPLDADKATELVAELADCALRAQAADLLYSAVLLRQAASRLRLQIDLTSSP